MCEHGEYAGQVERQQTGCTRYLRASRTAVGKVQDGEPARDLLSCLSEFSQLTYLLELFLICNMWILLPIFWLVTKTE